MPDFIEPLECRLLWSASLSGTFAGRVPAALNSAQPNHVSVRVINSGDQPASGPVNVNLYASSDPTLGPGAALLASASRTMRLRPGRGANVSLRFNSPAGLQDGNYFLLAQVGGNGVSAVVTSPRPVSIQHPFIDLVGQFSSFPVGAVDVNNTGNDVLAVRVINRGNVPAAGALAVSFYASTDTTPDAADPLIGVAARNVRIRPGGSQVFTAPITFPSGTAVGNYYVFAQVDSARAFAESNEDNNTVLGPRQLIAANVPTAVVTDHRDGHHHHGDDQAVVVETGGFIGGAIFVGDVADSGDFGSDPFMPDNPPPPDSGGNDSPPPTDSGPPADSSGDGWDSGSSSGSDF
jgi:hypothetical protein